MDGTLCSMLQSLLTDVNQLQAHKDDLEAVNRFSQISVQQISQMPFKCAQSPALPPRVERLAQLLRRDKRLWFDQQMLRIRTPTSGGSPTNQPARSDAVPGATEIKLRRENLTEDSWNRVSALNVSQMRSDWTFAFTGALDALCPCVASNLHELGESKSGDDAGGITREWFEIMTGAVFNEGVGLFKFTESHNLAYQINDFSGDLNGQQHLVSGWMDIASFVV